MTKAPSDSTVAATALVSGLRRWYGLGVGGARLARNAVSSGGSWDAASGATCRSAPPSAAGRPPTPPPVDGSIGALLRVGEPDRLLALREASDEAPAQRAEDREDDEVRCRLVDRVG